MTYIPVSLRKRDAFDQAVYEAGTKERRRRIRVAVWAYSYENLAASIVSDAKFDKTCLQINLAVDTADAEMDTWFRKNFHPDTGQWIHSYPHPQQGILHVRAVKLCKALKIRCEPDRDLARLKKLGDKF